MSFSRGACPRPAGPSVKLQMLAWRPVAPPFSGGAWRRSRLSHALSKIERRTVAQPSRTISRSRLMRFDARSPSCSARRSLVLPLAYEGQRELVGLAAMSGLRPLHQRRVATKHPRYQPMCHQLRWCRLPLPRSSRRSPSGLTFNARIQWALSELVKEYSSRVKSRERREVPRRRPLLQLVGPVSHRAAPLRPWIPRSCPGSP
ncbi:hypothetical protein ABIC10_008964 [Bradyrhizobium sp. S3.2.12]